MPIETICQGCGQRLRVADEHAGKKARCPNCQTINAVPADAMATSATRDPYAPAPLSSEYSPVAASSPLPSQQAQQQHSEERWTLKIDDGRTFGPVDRAELDKWFADGRITPACQLQSTRDNRWRPAGEIYPSLGVPARTAPAANPFADREAPNPYASPGTLARSGTWREPHNGVLVLVLGIVGCMLCALVAPVAVYLGHSGLSAIKAGRMDPEGHGLLIAGTVLGWIGVAQLALGFFFFGCVMLGAALDH